MSIIAKKMKLMSVNNKKYFFVCPGYSILYSLKVIRLASEAISVPVPPMFTPSKRE